MNLLIAASAAARLEGAIDALAPGTRLLRIERSGEVRDGARFVDPAGLHPDIAWLSLEIFTDALLPRFMSLVERSRGLRWLQTVHAGLDLPFYADLLVRKVRLCNAHVHAPAIAEYVMGQVLATLQDHEGWQSSQRARRWRSTAFREVGGSRWLLIGVGHVGSEIARRATAFGAQVTGIRRRAAPHVEFGSIAPLEELHRRLPEADVVVLACSLNAATKGLADSGFFAAMKPGAVLVNVARGGLVDEAALLAGLDRGRPGHAVLDVTSVEPLPTDSPLWAHSRVKLTAHSAFAGSGTPERSDRLFLDNLRRFGAGEPLLEEVTEI